MHRCHGWFDFATSHGAVLNSIKGSETLDNPMNLKEIRNQHVLGTDESVVFPYESGIKSGSADVYVHEMPVGSTPT